MQVPSYCEICLDLCWRFNISRSAKIYWGRDGRHHIMMMITKIYDTKPAAVFLVLCIYIYMVYKIWWIIFDGLTTNTRNRDWSLGKHFSCRLILANLFCWSSFYSSLLFEFCSAMSRSQAGSGGSRAAKYDYLIKLLLIGDSGNY